MNLARGCDGGGRAERWSDHGAGGGADIRSGTVKSTRATGLTLTTAAGQEVTVTVPGCGEGAGGGAGQQGFEVGYAGNAERCGAGR